jgi:hypothetical protein
MQNYKPNTKGNISESEVLRACIRAGFIVFVPFGNGAPYDLIVDTGRRLLRLQVKTGRLRNDCVLFAAQRINGHHGSKRYKYRGGEFDFYAVYCPDNEKLYLIPMLGDLAEGRLRLCPTKNNQQQKVRWASEFEFEIYIKRFGKEVELVGFEPTTSAMPLQRSSN